MRQQDDIRERKSKQARKEAVFILSFQSENHLPPPPSFACQLFSSQHRLSILFHQPASQPVMTSLFKFFALAGLVVVASGDVIETMDETIEQGVDFCGCKK